MGKGPAPLGTPSLTVCGNLCFYSSQVKVTGVKAAPAELLRWFQEATSLSRCCPRYFLFDAGASAFPGEAELLAALARQPGPDGSVRLHTSPRRLDAALTVCSLSV